MKEAIERVIAELEEETAEQKEMLVLYGAQNMTHLASLAMEYIKSHEDCIAKIKEVLTQHADNPSERISADTERTE